MHTLHFITRLIIGGAQENTLLTCEDQLRMHGDDVLLVTGPGLGPEGSLEERARRNGVEMRVLPNMVRAIRPWADWRAYRELKRLLREVRPEILHTHSSKAGIIGRAAGAAVGIPVVHTVHGASFHVGQSRLAHGVYRAAERWAGRRTDHFITVADAMTDQYVEAGVAERERFTTIHSGFEVEPFLQPPRPREDVRRELGFEPDQIVVGKIARLFHLKGHEFVIAAARRIVDARPEVRFLFVGDGILRERYDRDIAEAGLTDNFVFTGLVPPTRIPELMHAMDVVVHTSVWEGLARVLPQGLISGKPVVSYDVDGAREVVIPGETGFLLPPESVDELVEAVTTLAGDPEMRERMGRTGRTRFTDQFRHETMTRRIREVYERVLAQKNGQPTV